MLGRGPVGGSGPEWRNDDSRREGEPARVVAVDRRKGERGGVTRVVVADVPGGFESALVKFRQAVMLAGTVREVRRRATFVPPSLARKQKSLRARQRRRRGRH